MLGEARHQVAVQTALQPHLPAPQAGHNGLAVDLIALSLEANRVVVGDPPGLDVTQRRVQIVLGSQLPVSFVGMGLCSSLSTQLLLNNPRQPG